MKYIICTVTNDLTYDQRMHRICSSLVKANYQVTLVGRKKKNSKSIVQKSYHQKRLNCFFQSGKLFYAEYNIRLFLYLLFQHNDIFYAVDLDTIGPNFLISRWKSKPCVYDAHEYFTETPEVVRRRKVQRIWEWIANVCIPKMTCCITVGSRLSDIMSKRYQTNFEVVRNVPLYQAKAIESNMEPPVLLYQGMLNEGRGLEAMITAMEGLDKVELWLIGEGDLSKKLREMVKEKNLSGKVKFLGFVPPSALHQFTAQARIGLNLLENKGLSYYYSLANKAFDYVQTGIPSIHMDFPEYRQLNEQYEVFSLLDDLEISTIQAAINQLLQRPEYYQKLQENCRVAAQEWCWEKEEKILLACIDRIE